MRCVDARAQHAVADVERLDVGRARSARTPRCRRRSARPSPARSARSAAAGPRRVARRRLRHHEHVGVEGEQVRGCRLRGRVVEAHVRGDERERVDRRRRAAVGNRGPKMQRKSTSASDTSHASATGHRTQIAVSATITERREREEGQAQAHEVAERRRGGRAGGTSIHGTSPTTASATCRRVTPRIGDCTVSRSSPRARNAARNASGSVNSSASMPTCRAVSTFAGESSTKNAALGSRSYASEEPVVDLRIGLRHALAARQHHAVEPPEELVAALDDAVRVRVPVRQRVAGHAVVLELPQHVHGAGRRPVRSSRSSGHASAKISAS